MKIRDAKAVNRPSKREIKRVVRGVHVVPASGGKWKVYIAVHDKTSPTFVQKAAAVEYAKKQVARTSSEMIVHGSTGRIKSHEGSSLGGTHFDLSNFLAWEK